MLFAFSSPVIHSRIEHLDASGRPVISIVLNGGGEFQVWSDYRDAQALKIGTQRSKALAIGLFIDFIAARGHLHYDQEHRHRLFQAFADALVLGTIQGGNDLSGLYWLPRSQNAARRAVAAVTEFSDWLAEERGVRPVNPTRRASFAEQIVFWRAWRRSTKASLLKHLKSSARAYAAANTARVVSIRGHKPALPETEAKAFPEGMFSALLRIGFERNGPQRWTTYRDQAITLLLHEGGLRLSEPMHLWLDDVFLHPEDHSVAVVRVYHPTDGLREYLDPKTGSKRMITRAEVLRLRYDRLALTELAGKRRVGWKEPLLSDRHEKYFHVFWRSTAAARTFLRIYEAYLRLRPRVTTHPYLFITSRGTPMTDSAFEKVHAAAVRRIGLEPAMALGTTPHGHRHAYGQYLRQAKLDRKVIQVALHHKSVLSQDVYTEANVAEVAAALLAAEKGLGEAPRFEGVCL